MREISGSGLAKLATKKGTEPILIVEVDWGVGGPVSYADRDIVPGVNGRILQVGDLDNIVDVFNSNSSQELSIVLDDTDGSIKAIMDSHDVHQRDVRVYQWFSGLDISDKFLLFAGKISSPFQWSEAERTVSFTILSQLEDKEFGFSAEEGQFPFVPKDLVGKPWPVIFGKVLDVPALQVNKAVSGSTLCGVGIISGADYHTAVPVSSGDCGWALSMAMAQQQVSFLLAAARAMVSRPFPSEEQVEKARQLQDQAAQIQQQMSQSAAQQSSQQVCGANQRVQTLQNAEETGLGCNPVRILGGEDFPQEVPITLNINGGLFTGIMRNDEFTISTRRQEDDEARAASIFNNASSLDCTEVAGGGISNYDFSIEVPPLAGNEGANGTILRHQGAVICFESPGSGISTSTNIDQVAQHFWAEAGSRVVLHSDEPISYIVSITPGQVLAVKAFKTLDGVSRLVNVPNDLWTTEVKNYGPISATIVTTRKPLSSIPEQGWDDDLYVTFESTIGPNTVDILEYIIQNWTDLDFDSTSFNYVKTKLNPFPSNFPVLDRKNTLELIREIAFQARCAIWLSNGVFHLKYLPEEPAADKVVTVSDITTQSIEVGFTHTEDLVTKMVVRWRLSYADEEPHTIVLRHNVNRYGTKESEFDWYIYNQPDIILKAATFWLIRKSNTWKRISFRGFLNLLALETFDTIDLQTASQRYVASTNVKAIVEKATYNSESNEIDFECLVPVKIGTMEKYKFFWPSSLTVTDTFPTPQEIAAGDAGGNGIGAGATGELPIGYTDGVSQGGTVIVGGPNVVFRGGSDRGDRTPTDAGFVAQTILPANVFAEVVSSPNPNPFLSLNFVPKMDPIILPQIPGGGLEIDIRTTRIVDSARQNRSTTLDSLFREVNKDRQLVLDAGARVGDGTSEGKFDYKFDETSGQFGAGTAFLKK